MYKSIEKRMISKVFLGFEITKKRFSQKSVSALV